MDILCVKHKCKSLIYAFKIVEICPNCERKVDEIPVNLENPFVKANQNPCSVLLRPSGDSTFLSDFKDQNGLHIGVTNSKGTLFEFDVPGLVRTPKSEIDPKLWSQCLVIIGQVPEAWTEHWNQKLEDMIKEGIWTAENYNPHSLNCFSFVLEFLRSLNHKRLSQSWTDKNDFSEKFIVPRTKVAAKFITLYRKIKTNGFTIENI